MTRTDLLAVVEDVEAERKFYTVEYTFEGMVLGSTTPWGTTVRSFYTDETGLYLPRENWMRAVLQAAQEVLRPGALLTVLAGEDEEDEERTHLERAGERILHPDGTIMVGRSETEHEYLDSSGGQPVTICLRLLEEPGREPLGDAAMVRVAMRLGRNGIGGGRGMGYGQCLITRFERVE